MAFALLIAGSLLLISAMRNTQGPGTGTLFTLVAGEFSGTPNFIYWIVSIFLIGAVGYIPKLKPISTAFLALVVVVLALVDTNTSAPGGGFFAELTASLSTITSGNATALAAVTPAAAPTATAPTATVQSTTPAQTGNQPTGIGGVPNPATGVSTVGNV